MTKGEAKALIEKLPPDAQEEARRIIADALVRRAKLEGREVAGLSTEDPRQ